MTNSGVYWASVAADLPIEADLPKMRAKAVDSTKARLNSCHRLGAPSTANPSRSSTCRMLTENTARFASLGR